MRTVPTSAWRAPANSRSASRAEAFIAETTPYSAWARSVGLSRPGWRTNSASPSASSSSRT